MQLAPPEGRAKHGVAESTAFLETGAAALDPGRGHCGDLIGWVVTGGAGEQSPSRRGSEFRASLEHLGPPWGVCESECR